MIHSVMWVTSFIVFPNNTSETFRLDSFYEPRDTVQTTRVHDNSLIFRSVESRL